MDALFLPPCTWIHSNLVPFFFLPSFLDRPELKQSSSQQNSPEQITEMPLFNTNSFSSPQRPCVCQTPSVKITCGVFDVCVCVKCGAADCQRSARRSSRSDRVIALFLFLVSERVYKAKQSISLIHCLSVPYNTLSPGGVHLTNTTTCVWVWSVCRD